MNPTAEPVLPYSCYRLHTSAGACLWKTEEAYKFRFVRVAQRGQSLLFRCINSCDGALGKILHLSQPMCTRDAPI